MREKTSAYKAPCEGCGDRVADPNCHTTCERYAAYRAHRDAANKARADEHMVDETVSRDKYMMHTHYNKHFGRRHR